MEQTNAPGGAVSSARAGAAVASTARASRTTERRIGGRYPLSWPPRSPFVTALCYGVSNFVGPLLSRDLPTYALLVAGQVVALTVSVAVVAVSGSAVPGRGRCGARRRWRAWATRAG